jgi:adenylylsulfate kinase-like enzyme
VDGFEVAGGGIVAADNYPRRSADSLQKSHNIYWSHGKVTLCSAPCATATRRVVWLTGLSASGKSTISTELERELFNLGRHVYVLDGDNMRHGLVPTWASRPGPQGEHPPRGRDGQALCRRGHHLHHGLHFALSRGPRHGAADHGAGTFVEVYVNAPVEICEQRDPKGLYAKARANQIKDFTGISAPYEAPLRAEIELHTDQLTVAESVARIIEYLRRRQDGGEREAHHSTISE